MTTKVEFLESGGNHLATELCKLAAAYYESGERVYLWTPSEAEAIRLNELLWTYDDQSFVPHGICRSGQECGEPVAVGAEGLMNPNGAGLLLLAGNQPHDVLTRTAQLFPRVVDLVPARDEAGKKLARERFRAFREAGFSPEFIKGG